MKCLWKRILALCAVALAATGFADMQMVYRGRLAQRSGAAVTEPQTVSFNLYAGEAGGESVWGLRQSVTPDANGSIEAILADGRADATYLVAGATLTNVVRAGRARYIGVTVQGGRELLPRQAIYAQPYACEARRAAGIAQGATLGRLTTEKLAANELRVGKSGSLTVLRKLQMPGTDAATRAPLNVVVNGASLPLQVRGSAVKPIWGDWRKCEASCLVSGTFTPPADGVYLLTTLPNLNNSIHNLWDLMVVDSALGGWWAPSLVFFGHQGKKIDLPYVGELATGRQPTIYYRPFNLVNEN